MTPLQVFNMFNSIRGLFGQSQSDTNHSLTRSNSGLTVESLEPRLMLSTVEIFVAGETGEEAFNLLIDGQVAQTFESVGGDAANGDFEVFVFETEDTVTADRIEIEFINDDFDAETGLDRNLVVDGIIVDGVEFESEASTTFSTGFFDNGAFTGPGFLETEVLNVNGRLSFLADDGGTTPTPAQGTGTTVEIFAAGETGEEAFNLLIDGQVAQTFESVGGDAANGDFEVLVFETEDTVTADRIEIEFINDEFNAETGLDRNLVVDGIIVDGVEFESEASTTFSTGFFDNGALTGPGFLETEVLNVNGRLSFLADGGGTTPTPTPTQDSGTRIRIDAIGETGEENVQLQIDGVAVADFQFDSDNESQVFLFTTDQDVDLSQVRVAFTNDSFDASTGLDRNVVVSSFQTIDLETGDRQIAFTNQANVFSEGSFTEEDGVQPGFGRGGALVTDGFVEVRNVELGTRIRVDASGSTGQEILEVRVNDQVVGSFNVGTEQDRFLVTVDEDIPLDQVQIAFVNDEFDPAAGIDRNLFVSSFQVIDVATNERQIITPTDPRVFSTGTFLEEDGFVDGFGRGNTLNGNGFFQFNASV